MRKHLKVFIGLAVVAVPLTGIAGTALAQGPQPTALAALNGCRIRNGSGMMGGLAGVRRPAWGHDATFDAVTLTGLTEDEIIALRQGGQSLAQIVASKGVSEQALIDAIVAEKAAAVQALVDSGRLTQAQADVMLERIQEQVTLSVNRTETGPSWSAGAAQIGRGMGRGRAAGGLGLGPCGGVNLPK